MAAQLKEKNREILNQIIELLRESKEKPAISDLIEICAGLSYQVGKSIANIEDEVEWGELRRMHLSNDLNPVDQLGVTLMLQGVMIFSYKEDYLKIVEGKG